MLRTELKEGILVLLFAFTLSEFLTPVTIGLAVLGVLCIAFRKRPGRILRNLLAVIVLISYWFSYGKVIDPEVGLNFLTTVVVLKLLEKDSERDQYMIFFGLLLLLAAGSLFERTLTYMLFFSASFLLLIRDFYQARGLTAKLKDMGLLIMWILPLTFGLFLFIPRMMNPIPFNPNGPSAGEIGYTTSVNFSSAQGLTANDRPAFQALVKSPVNQDQLYWRGNTISQSDGWNWSPISQDRPVKIVREKNIPRSQGIHQSIRLLSKEEFLFSLDYPLEFSHQQEIISPTGPMTLQQNRRGWIQQYEVISAAGVDFINQEDRAAYLRISLPQIDREWIQQTFKSGDPDSLKAEIKRYLWEKKFIYSLKPGLITSFRNFMQEKKIGFCSHYASAIALIMRTKKIPARLVSGFMGGHYNPFGNFYLISQNDAHVWVEVLVSGKWERLDPTEWLAPDRVRLGGEAFMAGSRRQSIFGSYSIPGMSYLYDLRLWFGQWDFQFYQWLEQVNYHGQEAVLSRFKFKREWFYTMAPLFLCLFFFFYAWQLKKRKGASIPELEKIWTIFLKKLRARGVELPLTSIKSAQIYLERLDHPDQMQILELWKLLIECSYAAESELVDLGKKVRHF
ncbi:MAG TPA: transglutaminase domain-containing protein [Bacteriovoracaceae bacterium]|nr:transglutaminase domain-containing protein [Bacteriovoracaceae bacterium]